MRHEINALDTAARERLTDALDDMGAAPLAVAAKMALLMGLRIGEICALQWRDVDLDAGAVTVSRSARRAKGGDVLAKGFTPGRVRTLTAPPELLGTLKALKARQAEDCRVLGTELEEGFFALSGGPGLADPDAVAGALDDLVSRLGLVGAAGRRPTFSDLRHTWAATAIAGGMDPVTAARCLGHPLPEVTEPASFAALGA